MGVLKKKGFCSWGGGGGYEGGNFQDTGGGRVTKPFSLVGRHTQTGKCSPGKKDPENKAKSGEKRE